MSSHADVAEAMSDLGREMLNVSEAVEAGEESMSEIEGKVRGWEDGLSDLVDLVRSLKG